MSLCDPMGCSAWDSPSKNTGVGCHFLLQGIFPTQGSNLYLISPELPGRFFTTSTIWETPKYGINEPIYETGTNSDIENRCVVAKAEKGKGEVYTGRLRLEDEIITFRVNKQ